MPSPLVPATHPHLTFSWHTSSPLPSLGRQKHSTISFSCPDISLSFVAQTLFLSFYQPLPAYQIMPFQRLVLPMALAGVRYWLEQAHARTHARTLARTHTHVFTHAHTLLLLLLLPWLVPSSGVAGIADDGIPPCCPVCCLVVFQTHLCHVSLACVFPS